MESVFIEVYLEKDEHLPIGINLSKELNLGPDKHGN